MGSSLRCAAAAAALCVLTASCGTGAEASPQDDPPDEQATAAEEAATAPTISFDGPMATAVPVGPPAGHPLEKVDRDAGVTRTPVGG